MAKSKYPYTVFAEIHDHYGPVDRGDVYEDPLNAALNERGLGEITGSGSLLGEDGEIKYCGLDLCLANLDDAVQFVKNFLEGKGAPVGSRLLIDENGIQREEPFGFFQEFSVYVDANSEEELQRKLETECDFGEFNELMEQAIQGGKIGEPRGSWGSDKMLALYFFSRDVSHLQKVLTPILKKYPIFKGATILKKVAPGKAQHEKLE